MKRKPRRVIVRKVPSKGLTIEFSITLRYPWPPMPTILAEVRAAVERARATLG